MVGSIGNRVIGIWDRRVFCVGFFFPFLLFSLSLLSLSSSIASVYQISKTVPGTPIDILISLYPDPFVSSSSYARAMNNPPWLNSFP